jgi:hypothetical protein
MTKHITDLATQTSAARRVEELFEPYFDRADIAALPKRKPGAGEPIEALEQMYAYYEA